MARAPAARVTSLPMSDWSDFAALEEDDDLMDDLDYAEENDSQEKKAQVGSLLEPPSIEMDAEPIMVPQGKKQTTTKYSCCYIIFILTLFFHS